MIAICSNLMGYFLGPCDTLTKQQTYQKNAFDSGNREALHLRSNLQHSLSSLDFYQHILRYTVTLNKLG